MKKDDNKQGIVNKDLLISFILRAGLAIVFFYAAIAAFLDPSSWVGFIPLWIRNVFPERIFLYIHSVYNISLGLWLLSNKKIFYASILSALTMLAIVISNIGSLDILFRDVAILLSAVALAVLSKSQNN